MEYEINKKKQNIRGIGLQVIAAGRIVCAGGVPAWVGAHPGFADAITDNAAGDYTVAINATTAGYDSTVFACSQTADLFCDAVRATATTFRVTQQTDGGVLTDNGSIDICVVTSKAVKGISGLYPVAAGRLLCATATVVGVAEWGGAHPGLGAVTGGAGSAATGIYTVTTNHDLTLATYFAVVTSETALLIASVNRTGPNTLVVRTLTDAGADTEADVGLVIFGFQGVEGLDVVAAGDIDGSGGVPAWTDDHPGYGAAITDTGVGDYQVASNHNLANFTGVVIATVTTTGGIFASVVRTSAISLQVLCQGHGGAPADADLCLMTVMA